MSVRDRVDARPEGWGTWAPPTREPDTVPWLLISIALSVVLTAFVNVGSEHSPTPVAASLAD